MLNALRFVMLLGLSLSFISGCVVDPYGPQFAPTALTAHSHHERAYNYEEQRLYDQAIEEYNQALLIDPNYVSAYNNRGVAYSNKSALQESLGLHQEALELRKKALADWIQALKLDPNLAAGRANIGCYLIYEGKYDAAIVWLNQALTRDTRMSQGYINRALAFYYFGKYDKAREDVHRAQDLGTVIDPRFLEALNKPTDRPDRSFIEEYGKFERTFKFREPRVPVKRDWPVRWD